MSKNSYKAQLNYYDSKWGWKSEGTASQGQWDGTGVRTGVLYFPGLAALKGKIINGVKLTVTTGQTGYGTATTKTVYIYNSASQGGIKTSLNAGHRTGNALGSCKAPMWDNTKTLAIALPEDILKAKWCGDFDRAFHLIDLYLANEKVPAFMKTRLALEREVLKATAPAEHTVYGAVAEQLLRHRAVSGDR